MSALKPDTDSAHDLGTSVLRWRNLFVDSITVTDDLEISGNLTVTGNTTTLTTQALFVEDPLVKLNKGSQADPTVAGASDQGFVFSRANGGVADQANRVLLWDESEDEFAFGVSATENGTTAGNVTISAYSDVSLGKLVFDSAAGDNIEIDSSNLTLSATADIALKPGGLDVLVTGNILPVGDDTYDLGSAAAAWQDIFLEGDITMSDAGTLATTAGALTINGAGGLNLQEGGSTIFSISDARAVDLDTAGAITIDGASLAIGGDGNTGAIAVDSTAGISLDGAAASNFTLSDGDLSLIADGADNKVVIRGDATHATDAIVAVHIDAATSARSVVDIDAGALDIDVTAATTISAASFSADTTAGISLGAAAASDFTLSDGDLSLIADGVDNKVVIRGDATNVGADVVSIHLDGDAGVRSVVDIDAGILDIDATAAIQIDAAGAIGIESSGGAISLGAGAVVQSINIGSGAAARQITIGNAASASVAVSALDIDITAGSSGFAVSGAAASTLSTSSGALNITAAGASTFQTQAGALDITGAAASTFQTSAGALTINGAGGLNLQEGGANVIAIADDKNILFSHTGGDSADPDVEFDGYVRFDDTVELNSTVQVDGTATFNNTLTVGANTVGHDVKLFGNSDGQYLLWDESADELVLAGDSKLSFHAATGGENIVASANGHLEVNAGTTLDMTAPTVDINASTAVTLDTPSMLIHSSTEAKPVLEIRNETANPDAAGPSIKLALNTDNNAANNDVAGTIEFFADDAANNNQSYGEIKVVAADVTSGSEKGKMTLGVATTTAGSIEDIITITGGTNASGSIVEIHGSLNILGSTTTVDQGTMLMANSVTFEGSAANDFETVLTVTNPATADRTITLPDMDGHVPLLAGTISSANVTAAEFALLDGGSTVSTVTIADGDGIFTNDGGVMKHVRVQDYQTYFDANSVGGGNIVTVGALASGSIATGFGSIQTQNAITTTGLGTFGSLDVDDVVINGTTIGHTDTTDLLTLADSALTLKGSLTVGVDDTGHDVKLYGATAGSFLLWNQATDSLHLTDDTPLKIGDSQDMALYHDGTDSHIENSQGALNIATIAVGSSGTETVNIGNATSTVTMGQDLDVTRNLTAAKATVDNIDLNDKTITMTGSTGDTASFVVAEHGALSITTVDAAAAAANMTLTADGAFEAVGTTITLDSAGAIALEPGGGATLSLDQVSVVGQAVSNVSTLTATTLAGTLSTAAQTNVTSLGTLTGLTVSSTNDVSLNSTDPGSQVIIKGDATHATNNTVAIHIDGNTSERSVVDIDAGFLDIDTSAAAHIDAAGEVSLNGGAASDFTTSSGALTLSGAGGVTVTSTGGTLTLDGAGQTVDLNSAALDIDAAGAINIDSASSATLGATSFNIDADGGAGSGEIAIDTTDTTNGVKIATALANVPITLGNETSEVTVADNFNVVGITNQKGTFNVRNSLDSEDLFQVSPGLETATFSGSSFTLDGDCDLSVSGDLVVTKLLTSEGSELKIKDPQILIASEGPDPFDTGTAQDIGFFGNNSSNENSQTYLGLVFDNSTSIWRLQDSMSKAANNGTFSFNGNPSSLELGQIYLNDSAAGSDGVATPLTTHATYYNTGGSGETSTLAAGSEGQIKVLAMESHGGGDMVVTVTNPAWSGSTITLSVQGQACTLQYIDSKWYCIGNNGCAFG